MKRQRKIALLVLLCLCVLIGTVCGFLGYEMKRGTRLSEETPVTIPSGAGTAEVAAILEEENIIRYPLVFEMARIGWTVAKRHFFRGTGTGLR